MYLLSFPRSRIHTAQAALLIAIVCTVAPNPLGAQTRWDSNGDARDRSQLFDSQSPSWQGGDWLSGPTTAKTQWRIGVTGDNLDTGVLVRQVSSGSAAAKARIEVGDLIVNVRGFQVGKVEGRLYDLAEEINRRADTTGLVTLVVQDHVSGQLASVRVRLDNYDTALTGTLAYRERSPLPSDAVVTVQIENMTRPYYAVRNGATQFRPSLGNSIPFTIAYDAAYVNPQDTYQVRATVTSGGRTIMDTPQPQRVLTGVNSNQVLLTLAPVYTPGSGSVVSAGYPNFNDFDDRLVNMYRKYLNRDPSFVELAALRATPNIASRMETMPLEIMAGQEYFDAAGNNNTAWLDRVFREIIKHPPSQSELQPWMQRYADLRYSRMDLLRQLVSVSGR